MSNRFSRFVKALFGFDKQYPEQTRSISELNDSPNNNQNTQDNMDLVRRGHYCSKATLNSEVKDIIRILGPIKDKPGYYLTQDGKHISGYELDSYVLLDTVPDGEKVNIDKKRNIMGDFTPTTVPTVIQDSSNDDDDVDDTEQPEPETYVPQPKNKKKYVPSAAEIRRKEVTELIEKASIDKLNDYSDKKLGIRPYTAKKLQLTIDIEIPYEIKKLSQLCELFEIEYREVSDVIIENIELPKELIQQKIENYLRGANIDDEPQQQAPIVQQDPNQQAIVPHYVPEKLVVENKPIEYQPEIKPTVEAGISEVDTFLNDLFSKK